jgi:RNA 3'-terminal phosphate cyclase-like protein
VTNLTNGTVVEINTTGTQLRFVPGTVTGGTVTHTCDPSRSIGWYMEYLLPLLPFAKKDSALTLNGVTDGVNGDVSCDFLLSSHLPLLRHFGIGTDEDSIPLSLSVPVRGFAPLGNGTVVLNVPVVRSLQSVDLTDCGLIKRIRGTAITSRVPATSSSRCATTVKGHFHALLPDITIATSTHSGKNTGPSPGLKCVVRAESTTGSVLTSEYSLCGVRETAEDVGSVVAALLFDEVQRGGYVDSCTSSLGFLLIAFSVEEISRINVGLVTQTGVKVLREIKRYTGVEMKVEKIVGGAGGGGGGVKVTGMGIGLKNTAKKVT